MELVNTHCHSRYCGHGEGEVEEYAQAAEEAGLATLAFTEHYPLSAAFDPDGYLSVPEALMGDYRDAVLAARERHPRLEVLLGIELDYLSQGEDRAIGEVELAPYDLVLGSVHFVDGWPFDDPSQRDAWEEEGAPDRIWRRYVELWCEAAADRSLPFDVMSHPDLAKKFGYLPAFDLGDSYRRMAEAAREGGRMVEVNTSGAHYRCAEMFPSLPLLEEFCRAGVPCTIGSDAHQPAHVARGLLEGCRLMARAGYDTVTVPGIGRSRRTISLEEVARA